MNTSRILAAAFVAFGTMLHTYTETVETSSFSIPCWLWSLSPYLAGAVVLWLLKHPPAAASALVMPVILDSWTFYAVFLNPQSSTAGLGMLFAPLWNLLLGVPLGGGIGWWIGNRMREHDLKQCAAADRREDTP